MSLDRLQAAGLTIDRVNYELVYTAPLTKDMTLGDIWERFNIDHPPTLRGIAFRFRHCCASSERRGHRPLCRQYRFPASAGVLQEQQTPYLTSCRPNSSKPCPTPYKTLCKCWLTQTSGFMATLRARPLQAIAAQGYSLQGQLEKQQPEATPTAF